jgi:seryl-tRNA synthetase
MTETEDDVLASQFSAEILQEALVAHGLVIPTGVVGAFRRGVVFEDVVCRLDAWIDRALAADGAAPMYFPPVVARRTLEKAGYFESFPHLAGAVYSFVGDDPLHERLLERVVAGEDWADLLAMTDVALLPAACYPVYPSLSGLLPTGGCLVDTQNWIFRREPSSEPTRMQSFRMRELVRLGEPEAVMDWREGWLSRGLTLLQSLGLPARVEVASDPFFGRGGRLLSSSQKQQELKFEIVVPIISEANPTAIASFNYHLDHFGDVFRILTADGAVAHSACLGFGMERVAMALFRTHGFVPMAWPAPIRGRLWP